MRQAAEVIVVQHRVEELLPLRYEEHVYTHLVRRSRDRPATVRVERDVHVIAGVEK